MRGAERGGAARGGAGQAAAPARSRSSGAAWATAVALAAALGVRTAAAEGPQPAPRPVAGAQGLAPADAPGPTPPAEAGATSPAPAVGGTASATAATGETAGAGPQRSAPPVPGRGPALPSEVAEAVDTVRLVIETAALLGAIALLGYLVVRIFGPRHGGLARGGEELIRVLAVRRLEPRTTIYLLEVAGTPLVVSVSDRQVRALTEARLEEERLAAVLAELRAPGAREDPGPGGRTGGFRALLARGRMARQAEA